MPATWATWASVARPHILTIVFFSTLTYGWIFTGRFDLLIPLVAVWDWFIVNFTNKATDVEEDLANGIPGAEAVAAHARAVERLCWFMIAAGLGAGLWLTPSIMGYRVAFTLIGLAYNYDLVPVWRGKLAFTRFKELYFFKNFASSVLFVLTCFAYPIVEAGAWSSVPRSALVTLVVFFVAFELTYEILYDLRDLEGDRAEGVPTYPVVHGPLVARRIIDGLLALAAAALAIGFLFRAVGVRELLMLVAPAAQLAFYRPRFARGLTTPDCVWLTHLGTIELLVFLAGTEVWRRAGLPDNVWLGG